MIFISFSFVNTIFSHFSIWEMEGLVKRYFKFIWWFVKFAEKLPQMCLNSRADSTRRCYKNAFEKWCKWCVSVKLPSFPATEFHVSLYLIHLSDLRKSVSSINEVFYSISWAHKLAGVYNPCTSEFVLSVKGRSY